LPTSPADPTRAKESATRSTVESSARPEPVEGRAQSTPKDALLARIRDTKKVFYNMVVAQAQKIEVAGDRLTFTFSSTQRALRDQFEQQRSWLESNAQQIFGRPIAVSAVIAESSAASAAGPGAAAGSVPQQKPVDKKSALRQQALADAGVQAMLEVFPAEIRDVEEM
jgi:hypothetical protein